MSFKINATLVSPNKGIMTEAVVRIENYRLHKYAGQLEVALVMFKDEAEASVSKYLYKEDLALDLLNRPQHPSPSQIDLKYNDKDFVYPTFLVFDLTTVETVTRDVMKNVTTLETYNDFDSEGNVIQKTGNVTRAVPVSETVDLNKIDISIVGPDIFNWAYTKVKEKFAETFGAENLIDC